MLEVKGLPNDGRHICDWYLVYPASLGDEQHFTSQISLLKLFTWGAQVFIFWSIALAWRIFPSTAWGQLHDEAVLPSLAVSYCPASFASPPVTLMYQLYLSLSYRGNGSVNGKTHLASSSCRQAHAASSSQELSWPPVQRDFPAVFSQLHETQCSGRKIHSLPQCPIRPERQGKDRGHSRYALPTSSLQ